MHCLQSGTLSVRIYFCILWWPMPPTLVPVMVHMLRPTQKLFLSMWETTRVHMILCSLWFFVRFVFFFFFRGGRRLFSDPSLWIVVTVLEETIMPIHLFGIPWGKKSISVVLWSLVRRKTLAGASYYASMPLKYGKKKRKTEEILLRK